MTSIDSAARTGTAPPKILDLEWQQHAVWPDRFYAGRQYDFNYAEAYVQHETKPPLCMTVDHHGVSYDPGLDIEADVDAWIVALEQKISNRDERERAHRKYYHEAFGKAHVAETTKTINQALALYDEFGAACRDVKDMLRYVELRYLDLGELRRLDRILGKTRNALFHMEKFAERVKPKPKPYPLPLDDDFVERAVVRLTELDRDRHRIANGEGWSPKTSACGHWAAALLKKGPEDRTRALRVGKVLVSHHMPQLRKLGIVPAAVAARRAA